MTIKEFRQEMKKLGYKVRTHIVNLEDLLRCKVRAVDVYDGDVKITCGVMTKEHAEKYSKVFELVPQIETEYI